jgi:hypothetical protein
MKNNSKCLCGSNKKYNKCCKGNSIIELLDVHTYVPPKTLLNIMTRTMFDDINQQITKPHCKICGDTEEDEILVKIPTMMPTNEIKYIYYCEFCYNCQINM